MEILSYINNDILPLSSNDRIKEAVEYFHNLTYTHIPIVDDHVLQGLLSESDGHVFEDDKTVHEYKYALQNFFVTRDTLWLDVLEKFARNETNVMPVLDEQGKYIGYYELTDIMNAFSDTPFFNEPGSIIIVEHGLKDYSFSEISQIVEGNNAKLIGALISEMEEDRIQLTLKISSDNINDIMQTFRRYNYTIISGTNNDLYLQDLKDRSNYLNKYLNI